MKIRFDCGDFHRKIFFFFVYNDYFIKAFINFLTNIFEDANVQKKHRSLWTLLHKLVSTLSQWYLQ